MDGLSNTVTNRALESVLYENFEKLGVPSYTEDERVFAEKLARTYEGWDKAPGIGSLFDTDYAEKAKNLQKESGDSYIGMNEFLLPHFMGEAFEPSSTDVGDVSWNCPTAQIHVAAWPNGCPGHSWQNVSSAGTDIGHKAAVHAGKVLCAAAIDLYENPDILVKARAEFEKRTATGYVCPIPEGAKACLG